MQIDKFKKIVIKIGSSILIDQKSKPRKKWLEEFAKDIKFLTEKKYTTHQPYPVNHLIRWGQEMLILQ